MSQPLPIGHCPFPRKYPVNPAIELRRMTPATIDVLSRIVHQLKRISNGLKKIPPPIPVRPAKKPRIAPTSIRTFLLGIIIWIEGFPALDCNFHAENMSTRASILLCNVE